MERTIIEINGIKMEVDMSTAKRIDEFKIGDNIKVLKDNKIKYGAIVNFANFKELPTIEIAIFSNDYWGSKIEFLYYNKESTDIEILPCTEDDFEIAKSGIVQSMNVEIEKKQHELDELLGKRDWFVGQYGKFFKIEEETINA